MDPQIEYATEADGPGLAKINVVSFQNQGLLPLVFPGASPATLEQYKAIVSMKHLANPEMHVIKLVDPPSGEIVGYARWFIPKALGGETVPELSEKAQEAARDPVALAPRPMNEELYASFRQLLQTSRAKYVTDQDMMLDFLAISPEFQGRGLSSKLLRWGLSRADQFGARVFLESTEDGYPVYLKYGWKPLEQVSIDRSQHGGEGSIPFQLMMRDPQKK